MTDRAQIEAKRAIDLVLDLVGGAVLQFGNDPANLGLVVALEILLGELQLSGGGEGLDPEDVVVRPVALQVPTAAVTTVTNHVAAPAMPMSRSRVMAAAPLSMAAPARSTPSRKSAARSATTKAAAALSKV